MKNLDVLYVVPRCYTGSDRYYELLNSHIKNSFLLWLPRFVSVFPFLLFVWRFFSRDFFSAKIVHTNCENGIFLWSPFKKIVVTFHHDTLNPIFLWQVPFFKRLFYLTFTKSIYYFSMRMSYKIIFVNKNDYNKYSSKDWIYRKSLHISNGIDFNELKDVKSDFFKDKTNKKRVLFMWKKTVRKWWDLVEAISRLKNFQKLELYCTSMLGERTQWDFFIDLGALVRKDLLRLIKSVDIIFLPSRIEGFSYTIAESLSLGTPVLAREDWWGFADIYPDLIFFFLVFWCARKYIISTSFYI